MLCGPYNTTSDLKKNIHEWNMSKEYDNIIYVHRSKKHHMK